MKQNTERRKTMKRITASFLAAVLAAGLAGCAAAPSSSVQSQSVSAPDSSSVPASAAPEETYTPDWRMEPYLKAAKITGLQEMGALMRTQTIFSHLAVQTEEGGGWQFLNAATGRIFPEGAQSEGFIGMTFQDALPFGDAGSNFPALGWTIEEAQAYAQTIQQEEGVQLSCGAHGGVETPNMVWTEQGMMSMEIGPYLSPNVHVIPDVVEVAWFVDLTSGKWAPSEHGGWNMVSGTEQYDGVVLMGHGGDLASYTVYEKGLPYREGVAAVRQNGKWGYVNQRGTPITEFCYDPVMTIQDWFAQPDDSGEYPIERAYPYSANEGYIPVMKDGLCGVIDTQGNEVVPLMFEDITSVYDGAVWVKTDGLWGLLNLPETQA